MTLIGHMENKVIAIILARGGSKGIPDKNIIDIKGKPLLAYTIEVAQGVLDISEVWVSTDSEQIEEVAVEYGANVLRRPKEISGDKSQSEEALKHFAQEVDFNTMVFIQPTSPLLQSKDVSKGLKMMGEYDSIFSAYKEHWIPRWTKLNTPYEWSINNRPMRQDKEELFVENGAFYITTKKGLLSSGLRYSGKIGICEMPLHRSFQIDTQEDLKLIKKIMVLSK